MARKKLKKWLVTLERTEQVDSTAEVTVEAYTEEEAKEKAEKLANEGEIPEQDWETVDSETTSLSAFDCEETDQE